MFKRNKKKNNKDTIAKSSLILANNPTSIASEQLRTIRTNIQFSMIDENLQTISITSAAPDSGKTTIASNLATAFATEEKKVLLVDADLRRPIIHRIFRNSNAKGLSNLITNKYLKLESVINQSNIKNLYYLTSGVIPPNPSDLLSSQRMDRVIEEMKEQFDLIIFDNPPILAVTDAQVMATKSDGTIVIIPEGEVTKDEIIKVSELLNTVNAKVLGSVMNKVTNNGDEYYYYGTE